MNSILFDDNCQKELDQKGYTKVQFLSPEEIAYILRELRELRPNNDFAPNADGEITYHDTRMDKSDDYKRRASDLINNVFSPRANQCLNGYEHLMSSFIIKAPGKGDLAPHQHPHLTTNVDDKSVVIWCPLVDVGEQDGTLQVVEGSHKIGIGYYALGNFFANHLEKIKPCSTPIIMKAGEGLIFDNNLIHWSDKNRGATARIAAVGVFVPVGSKPGFYYYDPNATKHFEVFEVSKDFYFQYPLPNLFDRPHHLKSLGFVENNNRMFSEKEFFALLNIGGELKPEIRISRNTMKSNRKVNTLKRIRSFFNH